MALKIVLLTALLIAVSLAEVAEFWGCAKTPESPENPCTVSQVRIDPCKGGRNCVVKGGKNASISFDFTPHFAATKLKQAVYWQEIPFGSLDPEGCKFTECPLESGKNYTFNYLLHLGKKLPHSTYEIVWKLWNEDKPTEVCCLTTKVQLKK